MVEQFAKVLQNETFSSTLGPVMKSVFYLYCVHGIVEQARDFLEVRLFCSLLMALLAIFLSGKLYFK